MYAVGQASYSLCKLIIEQSAHSSIAVQILQASKKWPNAIAYAIFFQLLAAELLLVEAFALF